MRCVVANVTRSNEHTCTISIADAKGGRATIEGEKKFVTAVEPISGRGRARLPFRIGSMVVKSYVLGYRGLLLSILLLGLRTDASPLRKVSNSVGAI
jgi:hypothetical protein